MTESLSEFVRAHANDDVSELLLSAGRYPEVDMKIAAVQIQARMRVRGKLPHWWQQGRLFYPSVLAAEQCSSELTARYKQQLVHEHDILCDLTGGLGVDAFFFSQKVKWVTYVEKMENYCEAARYNMSVLGVSNVGIVHGDAVDLVESSDSCITGTTVFYIDPARRGVGDKRVFALRDCEPDLTYFAPLLLKNGRKLIAKLSPMLDITAVLNQLPAICEVHILSVKNECKELLVVAGVPDDSMIGFSVALPASFGVEAVESPIPLICCVHFSDVSSVSDTTPATPTTFAPTFAAGGVQSFRFTLPEEQQAVISFAVSPGRYLYEPNASILKAGAFKSVAVRFGLDKLHAGSHLYTSDCLLDLFPGRCFEVEEVIPFSSRLIKRLSTDIPQANIAVRNFPLSVDELRKRTRIADGGDVYLFATTLSDNQKVLLKCYKVI